MFPRLLRSMPGLSGALALACCFGAVSASDPGTATEATAEAPAEALAEALDPQTAELLERERIRTTILDAFESTNAPAPSRAEGLDNFAQALGTVLDLGPTAVSYLIPEVQSPNAETFFFSVVALGYLGGPEAESAVREAIALADREPGKFAQVRKLWAGYALALLGAADAVDSLDEGQKPVGHLELFSHTTGLEAAAIAAAPASVPRLVARLDEVLEHPEEDELAARILKALRRTGDPRARSRCLGLLDHSSWRVRRECAEALRAAADPKDRERMEARLDDPERRVRWPAAAYLEDLESPKSLERLLAALETEDAVDVRGALYRTVAALMGERALPLFRTQRNRENYMDRYFLAEAVAGIDGAGPSNLLRELQRDVDVRVQRQALRGLADRPGATSRDALLLALRSTEWPVVRTAIEELVRVGDRRAAPRIADLLLNNVLPNHTQTGLARVRLSTMADALVALGFVEVREDLRERIGRVNDIDADEVLERTVRDLGEIAERKDDVDRWIALLENEDAGLRRLAVRRLGTLGGDRAVDALTEGFDERDQEEQLLILETLTSTPAPRAGPLAERLLLEPAYDTAVRAPVRGAAAWLARRIGGPAMADALRRSVERREGADFSVLVYLGVLAGREAVPTFEAVRRPRGRRMNWKLGWENDEVLWMIGQLSRGRPIDRLDVPPTAHKFPE